VKTSSAAGGAAQQAALRQLIVGLLALPLSLLPFLAYGMLTPEGRLVRDKVMIKLSPPRLPVLSAARQQEAANVVPDYTGRVMALVYHGIGSSSDAEGGYVMSAARFGEHLAALKAAGMNVVTAADVAWSYAVGAPLPDRAVMISFDDGRSDAMMFADPLLEQAGMKATMFVISGAASQPGLYYAGWDRLQKAARSGRWDIEAHSDSEHHLQSVAGGDELPALTSLAMGETLAQYQARVHDDLERNSAAILAHVGQRPVAFAYPFGAYGAERTNDRGIEAIVRDEVARRFVVAFEQDDQATIPLVDTTQPRVRLRRMAVGNWSGIDLLHHIAGAVTGANVATAPSGGDVMQLTMPAPKVSKQPDGPSPLTGGNGEQLLALPVRATQRARPTTSTRRKAPPARTTAVPTVSTPAAPAPPAVDPGTTSTTGPTTTTTTGPTTTTTGPPTSTTTRPPTTTTTRPPTTTTTTTRPTTTTTGPTTTTTAPCHGNVGGCKS
jgi:peptidoglycan/xylan/chitin deacetylase (PgdA/CDA1 family)